MPGHAHSHGVGGHREAVARSRQRLLIVAIAGSLVLVAELVAGYLSNSLVLLADAGHYATDVASVLLSLMAASWALKPANERKSFGYARAEVVSAFLQAIALWIVSVVFLWEAVQRLQAPATVHGRAVMLVGGATLVVNVGLAVLLQRSMGHNLNVRAAYAHILSDVLGSAAALVAGALVLYKGWTWADPVLTILVTILIVVIALRLTRQSLHILLEGTPVHLDLQEVREHLLAVPGVAAVHDLHVWTHTPGSESMTAHVVLQAEPRDDAVVHAIHERVRAELGIRHVTVQVESPACPCDAGHRA